MGRSYCPGWRAVGFTAEQAGTPVGVLTVLLTGALRAAQAALPGPAYAATKWALEALVEGLAIEVAPFGVPFALTA